MIDIKDQYFGTEIQMTGITRQLAAEVVAEMFGTKAVCEEPYYETWSVKDRNGQKWEFGYDKSIMTETKSGRHIMEAGRDYSTKMISPKLSYDEMGKLQEVVRCLKRHGGFVNESCGQYVQVDASNHTPQSLKNALTIMYGKEDILFNAIKIHPLRAYSFCQKVRPEVLKRIREIPSKSLTMEQIKNIWQEECIKANKPYDSIREYALNLDTVFSKGTLEWRCFEGTLHAEKVQANITLALAISAKAINQKTVQMKKTPITENPAYTFRTFLLELGLCGREYKNIRQQLMENLEEHKSYQILTESKEVKHNRQENIR